MKQTRKQKKPQQSIAENPKIRRDPVSGEFVIISPARKYAITSNIRFASKKLKGVNINECPFENPQESGNAPAVLTIPEHFRNDNWRVQVFPNLNSAVFHGDDIKKIEIVDRGPYETLPAIGYHEILITKDHYKKLFELSVKEIAEVLKAFQIRYREIQKDKRIEYISIFQNSGPLAGASQAHPHCQILSVPIIPPNIERRMENAKKYAKKHGSCAYCDIIKYELERKSRIVYQNALAIVLAPYASEEPLEMKVFPKSHQPFFEDTNEEVLKDVAIGLQKSLTMLNKAMPEIEYNLFFRIAPTKNKKKNIEFHWFIDIIPKISISAGFELSTGIEITALPPEDVVKILHGKKI